MSSTQIWKSTGLINSTDVWPIAAQASQLYLYSGRRQGEKLLNMESNNSQASSVVMKGIIKSSEVSNTGARRRGLGLFFKVWNWRPILNKGFTTVFPACVWRRKCCSGAEVFPLAPSRNNHKLIHHWQPGKHNYDATLSALYDRVFTCCSSGCWPLGGDSVTSNKPERVIKVCLTRVWLWVIITVYLISQVKPLIWIESVIEKHSHSRIEYMIKVGGRYDCCYRYWSGDKVSVHRSPV